LIFIPEATASTSTSTSTTMTGQPQKDGDASSVQVAVRVRPMLPHEAGHTQCIEALRTSGTTSTDVTNVVRLGGEEGPKFTFDQIFPLTSSQADVYQHRVAPLVSSCLQGYNATILAYGQTGSGKTHTIMGPSASITTAVQDERQAGVIPRAIRSMFEQLQKAKSSNTSFSDDDDGIPEEELEIMNVSTCSNNSQEQQPSYEFDVRVQFLEVYGEEIHDLLTNQPGSQKLSIRDVGMDEPEVVGATQHKVESAEEALLCLTRGMYRRVTGATAMNESSSRSHAILSLIVEQSTVVDKEADTTDPLQQHVQAKRSKFNFVDLAGSERQKRTQSSGQRLKEGIDINKGLLVLGNVISALGDPKKQGKTFVPYRDSKLTRLLKGSLGGNHKTLMIACVSPASINMEETMNCLRYANRAKNIKNHAVVNLDATSRVVSELRGKMQLLAADLLKARDGNTNDCTIPIEVVESLAIGGDGEDLPSRSSASDGAPFSPTPLQVRSQNGTPNNSRAEEELQTTKAELEVYRLKLKTLNGDKDPAVALQKAFIARAAEYEREIAMLKQGKTGGESSSSPSRLSSFSPAEVDKTTISQESLSDLPPRTPSRQSQKSSRIRERSESPELSRLRAQVFGSLSQSNHLDAEVEAQEQAVAALTTKYLAENPADDDDDIDDDNDDNNTHENDDSHHPSEAIVETDEAIAVRLEADLFELSSSISAKEGLIHKLQVSQEKYEAMREFYEEKLRDMGSLLAEKESETEKLGEELKKLGNNHSSSKELAERLRMKQEQVAELKKKRAELSRLTSVASKNESQMAKLRNDVMGMKQKKIEMQKVITSERKSHAVEVQKLKKESMQKDREINKVKNNADKKTLEAERAQQMAKSRLEQMHQLKTRYRETEKRLRLQTVKRGVMTKAGLDPVMVGRRQPKNATSPVKKNRTPRSEKNDQAINVDNLRDFFDHKVADVSRMEALAEKLAQEWEEHLDLSVKRDEMAQEAAGEGSDSLQSLDSQIKYKEGRIRQLASRLGKRQKESDENPPEEETFLFDKDFKQQIGSKWHLVRDPAWMECSLNFLSFCLMQMLHRWHPQRLQQKFCLG
jgi:hypothetical protein